MGKTLADVNSLLRAMSLELQHALPDGIKLHPATAAAMTRVPALGRPFDPYACDCVEVYSDGSFDGQVSAWAVVVVGSSCGHIVSLHWCADRVCVDSTCKKWLGAVRHGSLQAEGSGVCFAIMWAIHAMCGGDASFHIDSLCAVMRAGGRWRFRLSDDIARASRSLVQAAEAVGRIAFDSFHHVKAHAQHPWNELADVLAKRAVVEDPQLFFDADVGGWIRDAAIEHLWLLISIARWPQHWPHHSHCSVIDSGPIKFCDELEAESCFGGATSPKVRETCRPSWQRMRFLSYNVQSLTDREERCCDFAGRTAYLRAQMEALGIDIAALQEARTSKSQSIVSDNFVRLCSGCDPKGQLGVELWFSRTGTAGRSGFRPEDLTVVYWDCRTLCVAVKTGCCRFLVVNVHAPTAQDDRREQWWRDLRGCLSRVSSGQAAVLMGDFNVRFNMQVLGRIGEHVWDSKHAVPAALPRLLEEHDVWFPSTYADIHREQHETWVAPGTQAGARIDYVAVPCSWVVQAGGSCVVVELDSGHTGPSITLLCSSTSGSLSSSAPPALPVDARLTDGPCARRKDRQKFAISVPRFPFKTGILMRTRTISGSSNSCRAPSCKPFRRPSHRGRSRTLRTPHGSSRTTGFGFASRQRS